jgi:hypothetical protein
MEKNSSNNNLTDGKPGKATFQTKNLLSGD